MPYNVALDAFHGPLDLLLFLVRRNEVDVLDIPVATVADQFLEYLRAVQILDVELAGDFLVMASTLAEIKSRMLLPAGAAEAPGERPDPRRELVKQLIEYRKFKDAATDLESRAGRQGERLARNAPPEPAAAAGPAVRPVELWDLVSAFARLMRETHSLQPTTIAVDDTPQHVYEASLRDRVRAAGRVGFRDAFTPPYTKARLIGMFLAILELIRHHGVGVEQDEGGGDLWLVPTPAADGPGDDPGPAGSPAGVPEEGPPAAPPGPTNT